MHSIANAHPDIQNMADGVVDANYEDGVARFLEQWMKES